MAKVTLKGLSHSYLKTQSSDVDWAIRDVDIDWNDGGAYALLGPSGCGKTTLSVSYTHLRAHETS